MQIVSNLGSSCKLLRSQPRAADHPACFIPKTGTLSQRREPKEVGSRMTMLRLLWTGCSIISMKGSTIALNAI